MLWPLSGFLFLFQVQIGFMTLVGQYIKLSTSILNASSVSEIVICSLELDKIVKEFYLPTMKTDIEYSTIYYLYKAEYYNDLF